MNILAILVSAVACFVIGFIFHVPPLGKIWMKLNNIPMPSGDVKMPGMWKQMLTNFVMNIICAWVLSGIVNTANLAYGNMTWSTGAILGAFLWLGFIVTNTSNDVIWMGKNKKAWGYEMLSSLCCLVVMGIILAIWK